MLWAGLPFEGGKRVYKCVTDVVNSDFGKSRWLKYTFENQQDIRLLKNVLIYMAKNGSKHYTLPGAIIDVLVA